jgi:glycosyltransferase involved in cell wall biosynthesis
MTERNAIRILQLNSQLTGGGTDDQCVKLAFGLRQAGQDARVAGPDGRDFSNIVRKLAIPFHATPPEGPLKLRFIMDAARLIRRERIQIVHGHHGRDIWPTILAARLSGTKTKVVLSRHLAKSPGSWFSRLFVLGQCDALIAVSDFVKRVLCEGVYEPDSPEAERHARTPISGNLKKIHVIHGGIDTERFRPMPEEGEAQRREWGLQPGDHAFAVAGGYDLPRGKGQREYLQAAARIHEKIPHARFLIVGRGSMETVLREDIERLGLRGKAWLTPYSREMPRTMNAIDCLVHPQVGTEAFGLVLLEAFACGKPVIASALDGIPEAFAAASFGRLVKPESVDELAAAMLEWAQKPALSMTERNALHERVERDYSVLALGRRTLRCYGQLLNTDAPSSMKLP